LDISRFIVALSKKIARIGKEITIIIGHLLKGLIILAGRKARSHAKPTIVRFGRWLKEKTIAFVRKVKPRTIETGQISRGLLILAVRKLKTKAIPMVKWIAQLLRDLSSRFYRKAKEVAWEKASTVRKELPTGKPKLLRLRLSSYHDPQKSFSKRKKQLTPTKNWLERLFKMESNVKP
jgi:hypothetical protein